MQEEVEYVDADILEEEDFALAAQGTLSPEKTDRRVHSLSDDERDICNHLARHGGVDYLRYERRWTAVQIKQFMARVAVQEELGYIRRLYAQREGIQERTAFLAQIQINKMVPAALNIVARAIRGDRLGDDGTIDRAPTKAQFDAALTVMDRANITEGKFKGVDSIPAIDNRSVNVTLGEENLDLTHRDARDKVRGFVDGLMGELNGRKKTKKKRPTKNKKRRRRKMLDAEKEEQRTTGDE